MTAETRVQKPEVWECGLEIMLYLRSLILYYCVGRRVFFVDVGVFCFVLGFFLRGGELGWN